MVLLAKICFAFANGIVKKFQLYLPLLFFSSKVGVGKTRKRPDFDFSFPVETLTCVSVKAQNVNFDSRKVEASFIEILERSNSIQ